MRMDCGDTLSCYLSSPHTWGVETVVVYAIVVSVCLAVFYAWSRS